MPIDTPSLIDALLEHHLLDGAAEAALPELSLLCPTAEGLVDELVRRRWLTHFQAELLLTGQAADLVVGAQYILLERLGQGGMGAVYKARHRILKAVRAVKVIHPERLTGANAVKRFFQEVEAVGKLFHPNIILPHDAGDANGVYWLAMEYVPGADLGRMLDRNGPLAVADACEYIRQGSLALQHAHERGLVHRDIKPANLLVSSADGRVKLLDLGLARVRALEDGIGPQTALTQAGSMMGTPDYMAPEQAIDSHSVDIRADIYALGCTLYHVLVGRPPFPGGSVMEKLVKHRMEEPQALETLRSEVPAGLGAVVRKALAKDPDARYQEPNELGAALTPFCAGASSAKPRPAGASGVHPIFSAAGGPSLATVVSGPERNRVPTPPSRPTMKAPAGAIPAPAERTVHSMETHVDPTLLRRPASAAPQRKRSGTHWPAVLAMVIIGALIAAGARFFQRHDVPEPIAVTEPPLPVAPAAVPPTRASRADPPHTSSSEPEEFLLAAAKPSDLPAEAVATARSRSNDASAAVVRPASFVRREPLYRLSHEALRAVAFGADGKWAAVLAAGSLDIYNLAARGDKSLGPGSLDQLSPGLTDPDRTPTAVALTADGRHAFLTTTQVSDTDRDGKPKGTLFNVVIHHEYQQAPEVLFGPAVDSGVRPEYLCVGVSSDGKILAAGSLKTGTASWWNSAVRPPECRNFKHLAGAAVSALAFSTDGRRVLFCGRDRDLVLHTLDLLGGASPLPLKGHPKGVRCAAFSADGRFAISGGRDGKVCVWDFTGPAPADGFLRPAKELSWHDGEVTAVAFAPSGDRFLTAGDDGYFCLGEVSRSEQLSHERPDPPPAQVRGVAFSADGSRALYATDRSLGRYLLQPPPLAEIRSSGGGNDAAAKTMSIR